ncbi:hypothetical protein Daus18300_005476 [Diaporthe australafricana]|uniref:Peptidase C45 hydrolase domain-containing protein n=1 Tax=Diaporthe australafricana TaxID=127596 RepID=A0ABR3X1Q9_9PEZI
MAEALGIAAAVVQFLDIGARLCLKIHFFASEVRDVPQKLNNLKSHLVQQIELAESIQTSVIGSSFSLSDSSKASLKAIVDEQCRTMEPLLKLLDSITGKADDGLLRRSWNGIQAIDKKKDIEAACDLLDKKSNLLSLWLGNTNVGLCARIKGLATKGLEQNVALSRELEVARPEVQAKLDVIPRLAQAIQISSTTMQAATVNSESERAELRAQLGEIHGLGRVIEDHSAVTRSVAVQMKAEKAETLAITRQTSKELRSLADNLRGLGPSVRDIIFSMQTLPDSHVSQLALFNSLLVTNPELLDTLSRAIAHDRQKPAELGENGVRGICETLREIHQEPAPGTYGVRSVSSDPECACRSFSRTDQYEPLSTLHFRKVFRRRHFASCPRSKISEDSLEYMMRVIPPKWLLSHTIRVGFSMRITAAKHSFSMAPMVFGVSRVVDKRTSPAFRLLENFKRDLYDRNSRCPGLVTNVESSLRDLVHGGLSSPMDEDEAGNTILYIVLSLYRTFGTRDHHSITLDDNNAEFVSLISFLLQNGSNPNVFCRSTVHHLAPNASDGGTAMDMYASDLSFAETHIGCPTSGALVRDKIASVGGEFSRHLTHMDHIHPLYECRRFAQELDELALFPEQFEICEYNAIVSAILRRSESSLQQALIRCDFDYRSPTNGLCAVHLAVAWPTALRRLISAGADINVQDNAERRTIQLAVAMGVVEAVHLLIEADCSITTSHSHYGLLQESLMLNEEHKREQISALIVKGMINRHTRFVNLALAIGHAHGSGAKSQVHGSIAFYTRLFQQKCALDWAAVTHEAEKYAAQLELTCPRYLDEIRGIAEGAGVAFLDVLALNVRTEIMFGLYTDAAAANNNTIGATTNGVNGKPPAKENDGADFPSDGCTSLAFTSPTGTSYLAQNWDWQPAQTPNLIITHISQPGTPTIPKIAMVTEAGIIGKIGLNSAGVGCCLNAIRARGLDTARLPVHFALRAVLESASVAEAVGALRSLGGVAGSAHVLVADGAGDARGLEFAGGREAVGELGPDGKGRVVHTNHLLLEHPGVDEPGWLPDSAERLERMRVLADGEVIEGKGVDVPKVLELFKDEDGFPFSINRLKVSEGESQTLFTIVMDLGRREALVKVGRPTEDGEEIHLGF